MSMKQLPNLIAPAFFAPAFFFLSTAGQSQTTKEEYLIKFENGKQFTLDVLAKMPDSGMDYKTDPEAMSFKEQIYHIANSIVVISQNFLNGSDEVPTIDLESASRDELAKYVADSYDYGIASSRSLSEADSAEAIEMFGTKVTRRQIEALVMDHATHHRGSAIAYLRAVGVEPPGFVGF
jgi:uncharacterized damage-inducible protein DinB